MTETQREWVQKRAYALWEEEGRPSGRDHAHWEQAMKERAALEGSAASADGKEVKSRTKRAAPEIKVSSAAKATKSAPKKSSPRKSA
ncbi:MULTISPECIES: DUF2934 domain-containing protein [unclassified Rhizobium]|uniref:DUF2934 domain-containing protein n=1 Tax=unclassified Rhizobium TaxID=2613769 RepID=UPI001ADB058A|nr:MULTISPECIES: DUF2934 domain-containing protein [unclassified Rhizobium]MBO9126866.1 DUF2934 domain-containing protein [Rhizobium sp. 16-488-2b]MBO9177314.1 DUF2934 domain-containing protein [Rhizobium sp. 16-488-2a]